VEIDSVRIQYDSEDDVLVLALSASTRSAHKTCGTRSALSPEGFD
jgi:hypothetical protein